MRHILYYDRLQSGTFWTSSTLLHRQLPVSATVLYFLRTLAVKENRLNKLHNTARCRFFIKTHTINLIIKKAHIIRQYSLRIWYALV